MSINTVVIPAAGWGTRSLTFTKRVPKEMGQVGTMPAIQTIVEEAVSAGVSKVVLIISEGKNIIADHFDRHFELERLLEDRGKVVEAAAVKRSARLADIVCVRQEEQKGLGHAILCAKPALYKDEPFAVILPDDIFIGKPTGLQQLVDSYMFATDHKVKDPNLISLAKIDKKDSKKYGIVEFKSGWLTPNIAHSSRFIPGSHYLAEWPQKLNNLVEKPEPEDAPSDLAITGRYILSYKIFNALEKTEAGAGQEIQLTDALKKLSDKGHFVGGLELKGERYDIGRYIDWVLVNIRCLLENGNQEEVDEFYKRLPLVRKDK